MTKIACIGDSLTGGFGVAESEAYPAELSRLLTAEMPELDFELKVFALTSATMGINPVRKPYYGTAEHLAALAYEPDIIFITLGTNDSKDRNWPVYGEDGEILRADMVKFITELRALPSNPAIW